MPIYEYSCVKTGEIKEVILPLSEYDRRYITCPIHFPKTNEGLGFFAGRFHDAEKIWSQPANIQLAPATKIFVNERTGETQMAMSSHDKAPYGFVEKELKGPIERSKFEKEDNERARVSDEFETHRMDMRRQSHQKIRQDDLRAKMNALQTEVHPDTGEKIQHFLEPRSKSLLKKAMEHTSKKRVPKKITERHLAVNHQNSSNMQDAPQGK